MKVNFINNMFNNIKNGILFLINIIKNTLKILFETPAITLFFVLYLILFSVLVSVLLKVSNGIFGLLILGSIILSLFAFLSGWFQVIKVALEFKKENNQEEKNKNYLSIFFEGVGKNIVPVGITCIICYFIFVLVMNLASICALNIFGNIDETVFRDLLTNPQDISTDKLYVVYGWNLCFIIALSIYNFLFLFLFPEIFNDSKTNMFLKPFVGFYKSILFTLKNFFSVFILYFCFNVFYIVYELSVFFINSKISQYQVLNSIFQFLCIFVLVYFIAGVVMIIFNYYEQKNNSSNRSDSIGENENSDCSGEEN